MGIEAASTNTPRGVATPCRVQPPSARCGAMASTPRGGPCRSPPTPRRNAVPGRSETPCRGGAWSPGHGGASSSLAPVAVTAGSARAPLGGSARAPLGGTGSNSVRAPPGGSSAVASRLVAPPRGVTVHRGTGSQHAPVATVPAFVSNAAAPAAEAPQRSSSTSPPPEELGCRSPLGEHEKLYDEDWWYWHLEDRRRGGAPPDAFITGDESTPSLADESLSSRDTVARHGHDAKDAKDPNGVRSPAHAVGTPVEGSQKGGTPHKGGASKESSGGRLRVPATGLAGADMAAGGSRCARFQSH